MRRTFRWASLLLLIFAVGCSVIGQTATPPPGDGGLPTTPTLSDIEMQTQIALLLTAMPTSTPQPLAPTATDALPSLTPPAADVQPTGTNTPEPTAMPTETLAPTAVVPTATEVPPTATALPTQAATVPAGPTFTPSASDPRARLGAPTSMDPMDDERAWVWPTGRNQFTDVAFRDGSMLLTAIDELDGWRLSNPRASAFDSLYLEGTFRPETCQGSDHYGMIVRVPVIRDADQGYLFGVTCDGSYSLRRWDGKVGEKGKMDWLVRWTAHPAVAAGANQTNRLGIMMVGSRLILYANGTLLTEVNDNTFSEGYFGVFVGADRTDRFTVRVDEMAYWLNPQP